MDLTSRTQEALSQAQQRAVRDGHPQLEPAHLLLAQPGIAGAKQLHCRR